MVVVNAMAFLHYFFEGIYKYTVDKVKSEIRRRREFYYLLKFLFPLDSRQLRRVTELLKGDEFVAYTPSPRTISENDSINLNPRVQRGTIM